MSRFVSGGTDDQPTERDDAWLQAQRELDAKHLARLDAAKQDGTSKSLYETLQANKAAKQEAFDKKAKLSNQFQNLNEDEVAFLDEVLQSTRERERNVKRETSEQVLAFKRQQEEAEIAARQTEAATPEPTAQVWAIGPRKRKKERKGEGIGSLLKVRRTSSTAEGQSASPPARKPDRAPAAAADGIGLSASERAGGKASAEVVPSRPPGAKSTDGAMTSSAQNSAREITAVPESSAPSPPKLGIVAYSSDEDE
nr:hypothetical protein CFP56_32503 [Quercus suber]